jgi:hypothetical protein
MGAIGGALSGLVGGASMGALGWSARRQAGINARMEEAERLGILSSGQLLNEVKKGGWKDALELITGEKSLWQSIRHPIKGYWKHVRAFNTWREGILRLAAARHFFKKLGGQKDRTTKRYYGASRRDALNVLYDRMDDFYREGDTDAALEMKGQIAAKMARELLGDYGAISESGRWLRRSLAPFWAWQEVNLPRYARLINNARYEGGSGLSRGIMLGGAMTIKTGIAVGALSFSIYLFNKMMKAALDIPEEEDPNRMMGRGQWIIVGRYDDGSVKAVKFSGAMMDAMGWFGVDDVQRHIENLRRADHRGETAEGVMQVAADVGMAPVQRLADVTTPLIKVPVEQAAGVSFYPDVRRPRKIRDRVEHLMSTLGLRDPYRVWAKTANPEDISNSMQYEFNPGSSAYWRTRSLSYDYVDRTYSREHLYCLTQAKSAWAKKDKERARYWMRRYWEAGGSSWKGYKASLRNGHPLAPVKKADREKFWDQLTEEDKRRARLGIAWWENVGAGGKDFDAMAEEVHDEVQKEKPKE